MLLYKSFVITPFQILSPVLMCISHENTIETSLTSKKGRLAKFCKVEAWSQALLFTGEANFSSWFFFKGRVTRIHIFVILYSVIFPKYYSYVSLIISNCFLAATQSKHWVKNLSLYNLIILILYNLMGAKMIEELEIAYMSFCASYTVILELDTKKKLRRKIWTQEWLLKPSERGAYNEILNELRLNKFSMRFSY